jgi:hypothetical protein
MVPRIPPPTMTTRPDSFITANKYSHLQTCIAKWVEGVLSLITARSDGRCNPAADVEGDGA